jgi:hypothetical protein
VADPNDLDREGSPLQRFHSSRKELNDYQELAKRSEQSQDSREHGLSPLRRGQRSHLSSLGVASAKRAKYFATRLSRPLLPMSNEEIPSWLKEDVPSSQPKQQHQYAPPMAQVPYANLNQPQAHGAVDISKYKEIIFWALKIMTLLLCLLMMITAVVGFMHVSGINETGQVMVAFYMIIFAAILAIFEIIQVRPCESLDVIYRRNFGFLYGTKGKSFFIILYATLSTHLLSSHLFQYCLFKLWNC